MQKPPPSNRRARQETAPGENGRDPSGNGLTPAPQMPADIPGLGPIRVRALQKAGYSTLESLREARIEDLMAVRGLTEIKARHILTFLAEHPEARTPPAPKAKKGAGQRPQDAASPGPDISLARIAVRALALLVVVLLRVPAEGLRPRLVREVARFVPYVEMLAADGVPLSEKEQDRQARRLRRICLDMEEFRRQETVGKKPQGQLADNLEEFMGQVTMPGLDEREEDALSGTAVPDDGRASDSPDQEGRHA
jgi:hypothetical protein